MQVVKKLKVMYLAGLLLAALLGPRVGIVEVPLQLILRAFCFPLTKTLEEAGYSFNQTTE